MRTQALSPIDEADGGEGVVSGALRVFILVPQRVRKSGLHRINAIIERSRDCG
jgi:hypothetical protein